MFICLNNRLKLIDKDILSVSTREESTDGRNKGPKDTVATNNVCIINCESIEFYLHLNNVCKYHLI